MSRQFLISLALIVPAACSHKTANTPPAPGIAPENAYFDLRPGSKLRVVLPLKSNQAQTSFEIAHYAVAGHHGRRVQLEFLSAEVASNGLMVSEPRAPVLPFGLPDKPAYIRLLYLQRLSEADHNMAVLAADRMTILEEATKQIRADPARCAIADKISCSWVPAHVAVRPD